MSGIGAEANSISVSELRINQVNLKMPINTRSLTCSVSRYDGPMKPMPESIACTLSTAPGRLIRPAMMNSVVVTNRLPCTRKHLTHPNRLSRPRVPARS